MSENNKVFLIDLSKQFPFEIDDEKKKDLCFSETLIISCAHGQGGIHSESAESVWSCSESSDEHKKKTEEYIPKIILPMPITPNADSEVDKEEEYDDFHFYFFPDCTKPHKKDSTDSIVLEDGMPIINLNKRGSACICNEEREDLCKCGKENFLIKCICGPTDDICACYPEPVEPSCPCDCHCDTTADEENTCRDDDSGSFCGCPFTPKCTCNNVPEAKCACFPLPDAPGNADICECCEVCDCVKPCVCDALPDPNECTCSEVASNKVDEDSHTHLSPPTEDPVKLKRKRAGKHGYRWCPEVDPKHTFFDYAYGRHDKIDYTMKEEGKVKIMGLEKESKQGTKDRKEVNEIQDLQFKKKVRGSSLDCCSAVGGITISVDVLGEDKNKFLIQVVSHSSKEGAKCGSKLISIVDCNLHTLEENRSEHITRNDIKKQRRSYMTICDNGYYNKVTRICGPRHVVKRVYHSFDDARYFLLEGANVVLLRYFAITRYKGRVKTHTVLINGTICENVYVCLGVSPAIVNGKPLFVAKVERHIIQSSGLIYQTLTVLSLRGYIVSHEWADTNYIFHVNPLLRVIPEKNEIEPHEPLREKWRSDLQLLSDYLDFKSARTSEGARYTSENGELTGVIRDYLQALLLLRPQDALLFTREYFQSAISDLDLAHNEFFQPCHKNVRYYFYED